MRNTGTEFVQAICRTSHSIDPGETPHLRSLIWVSTDQTSHVRTLELILFKQYAEQADSIDPGETPHLRGLIWFQTDKTSHVRTLELSLFKQHAEHLTVLIDVGLLI